MYSRPAMSLAAESTMINVRLLWSQQGQKIEYLMMSDLQQFQNFLVLHRKQCPFFCYPRIPAQWI